MQNQDEEKAEIMKEGTEAERLMAHPMINGFFSSEIDEVFNEFCFMKPGVAYEEYIRLHMEVHSLLNLKAKLMAYVTKKAEAIDNDRLQKWEPET